MWLCGSLLTIIRARIVYSRSLSGKFTVRVPAPAGALTRARYTVDMRLVLLLLLAAASLPAEFLEVRIEVGNMDCVTCVQSLQVSLRKIRGVEKINITPQGEAEFSLLPGNKVTLERLRDAIKGVGFTPKGAHVVARGKAITAEGKWRFEVDGIAKTYNLAASHDATIRAIRARDGQIITVKAFSAPPPDPRTEPSFDVESLVEASGEHR
jgi:copper chaperone CopZ